VRAFLKRS